MPLPALSFALAAAFLHAFWNLLIARSRDPESATVVALIAAVVAFAPVTALTWRLDSRAWPFIAVTSVLQLVYFALLATAYRKAELSFVYPLSRGLAPVLVLLVGAAALREATSGGQVAGVVLVAAGVLLVRGLRRPARPDALFFALGISACIASYTLLDKHGIRYAGPITYLELSMVPATLGYAAAVLAVRGRRRVRVELGAPAILAGLASFGAYALVLAALARAPAAPVAAVRETSVLFAAAISIFLLNEPIVGARIVAALLVLLGLVLVRLQ